MKSIRESICKGKFVEFIHDFMKKMYPDKNFPSWAVDALQSVDVNLNERVNLEWTFIFENSDCCISLNTFLVKVMDFFYLASHRLKSFLFNPLIKSSIMRKPLNLLSSILKKKNSYFLFLWWCFDPINFKCCWACLLAIFIDTPKVLNTKWSYIWSI